MKRVFNFYNPLFPTPSYIVLPSVAIDLSDRSVKFLELERKNKNLIVRSVGKITIPEGVVRSGVIEQPQQMKDLFVTLKSYTSKTPFVRVALPEEQAYVFELSVPVSSVEEIRSTVELQLEKYVPIPAHDAVFDFEVVAQVENQYIIIVSVMDQVTIDSYIDLCESAGFTPLSFELESYAVSRAVTSKTNPEAVLIIDCGDVRTGLSIVYKGHLLYTTTIDIGGESFTSAIENSLKISRIEAEKLKELHGLNDSYNSPELVALFQIQLKKFADQILKQQYYWNDRVTKHDVVFAAPVTTFVLCGGHANMKGFVENLEVLLQGKVERADVWKSAKEAGFIIEERLFAKEDRLGFSTCLGLALGDSIV